MLLLLRTKYLASVQLGEESNRLNLHHNTEGIFIILIWIFWFLEKNEFSDMLFSAYGRIF